MLPVRRRQTELWGWWRIAVVVGAFISVFFVIWELAEIAFLSGVSDETRKWLHIARGVFGAACIGILTAMLGRRHERRLAQMRQTLIQNEKLAAIGQMAAGLAHEVGNPLASISSVVQLLERRNLGESDIKRIRLIHGELERIHRIVRQLVDFARPAPTAPTVLGISGIVSDAVELARYDPRAGSMRFDVQIPSRLPPVRAVREHLIQVFLNVIHNAMDAMPDGGLLSIECSGANGDLIIDFRDNGVGIPDEQLERVFQPFFTTKTRGRGSGLGLAVTRQLLAQHDGSIQLDSTPGAGTHVRIRLPTVRDPEPATERKAGSLQRTLVPNRSAIDG